MFITSILFPFQCCIDSVLSSLAKIENDQKGVKLEELNRIKLNCRFLHGTLPRSHKWNPSIKNYAAFLKSHTRYKNFLISKWNSPNFFAVNRFNNFGNTQKKKFHHQRKIFWGLRSRSKEKMEILIWLLKNRLQLHSIQIQQRYNNIFCYIVTYANSHATEEKRIFIYVCGEEKLKSVRVWYYFQWLWPIGNFNCD